MSAAEVVRRVAVAVVLRGRRVLVQTRPGVGRWQGCWEFPGGGIEPGESGAAAARRECREEVGLELAVGQSLELRRWHDGQAWIELEFFLCTVVGGGKARPLLGQELAWIGAEELSRRTFLPANAGVIAWLTSRLAAAPDGPD